MRLILLIEKVEHGCESSQFSAGGRTPLQLSGAASSTVSVFLLILVTSFGWTGFCFRRLSWSDITYLFNRYGKVLTVKHPKP